MDWEEGSFHEEFEQDLVEVEDYEQFDLSCRPAGVNALAISKKQGTGCMSKRGYNSPLNVNYGYGGRTKYQDPLLSERGKEMPVSNQERYCKFVANGEASGHQNSASSPILSNQRNAGVSHGNFNFRSRENYQKSRENDQSRSSVNYGSQDNDEATNNRVRGPRAYSHKNPSVPSPLKGNLARLIGRDQYNRSDFQVKYEYAKFFMIKSFSEDDVHKSIKYNVWSSTPNGNRKLDAAYWDTEKMAKERSSKCPIFLFFSVNGSGQFVGFAEMAGPVDLKKNMSFWQEEKWNGFFPLKWRVIKDIPNRHFEHIRLENNNNRVVSFSRDTQEIGLLQGLKMLCIFKSYHTGSSMLDDFEFYEKREKTMRSARSRCSLASHKKVECNDHDPLMVNLEAGVKKMSLAQNDI